MVFLRLSITGEYQFPSVRGWKMNIQHLDGSKLFEHRAWRQARGQHPKSGTQMHVQTISHKRHKNVRFDPSFQLVKDRPQAQVIYEVLECGFDLRQLNVKLPQAGRILSAEIAAQQIAPFSAAHLS